MSGDLKVINLGLPKSGTTTLGKALDAAGLRVADWRIRRGNPHATAFGFVGNLMYHGYFRHGDPLALMPNFDAFSEIDIVRHGFNLWPQTDWGLISAIREKHPGARFVLTTRDAASVADSMRRWSNMGRTRLPANAIPGLPEGYGKDERELVRWIEAHTKFCRQVFAGQTDFLELDVASDAAKPALEKFLGLELPWWGTANENQRRRAEAPAARSGKGAASARTAAGKATPDRPTAESGGR